MEERLDLQSICSLTARYQFAPCSYDELAYRCLFVAFSWLLRVYWHLEMVKSVQDALCQ